MIEIKQLTEASPETLKDLNALLFELRGESNSAAEIRNLEEVINNPGSTIIVARDGGKIIGMSFLFVYQKLGKRKGWVEDVVVSGTYRGHGLGTKLVGKIIDIARSKKLTSLQLTSRLHRTAAHALYQKLGFEKYDTQVFRMKL